MSVRNGNREKGWNDPPEFLHDDNGSSTQSGVKKNPFLTQRVPHSFDGLVIPKKSDNVSILTEPPKSSITHISHNIEPKQSTDNDTLLKAGDISITELESILNSKIEYLKENKISAKSCEDISKRVKLFVSSWNKLNEKVKVRMLNLVKALEKSDFNTANEIHVSLMLDYPSEVSGWMVGIKKLIHESIALNESKYNEQATNVNTDVSSIENN